MAESKTKTGRLSEWLILVLVIVCVLLIVAEVGTNVLAELEARQDSTTTTQEAVSMAPIPSSGHTGGIGVTSSNQIGNNTQ